MPWAGGAPGSTEAFAGAQGEKLRAEGRQVRMWLPQTLEEDVLGLGDSMVGRLWGHTWGD